MSDRHSDRDLNDQTIEQILSRLKQLEPPLESRVANREAVAAELARMTEKRRERALPFWRRTVSVPWPVAAAVLAMLVALSLLPLRSSHNVQPVASTPAVDRNDPESVQRIENKVKPASKTPTLAYYETTTYMCGIGPLRSEAKYIFEE